MARVDPNSLAKCGSEHSHQTALFAALAELAVTVPDARWVFAVPNGFYGTAGQKGKMKAEGLRVGVWDVIIPFPRVGYLGHHYTGLMIEMKVDKNKLSKEQVEFGTAMYNAGWDTCVAYNWQVAYTRIKGYLCLPTNSK
jgi:hypothetical protein